MPEQRAQDPTAPDVDPSAGTKPAGGSERIPSDDQTPPEAFADVRVRIQELSEYAGYLISAKVDAIKLAVRNAGIYAALGVIGLLAAGAFVVTTIVLLCRGIAGGLGKLFGDRLWLGELVTSIVFLALLAGGVWFVMNRMSRLSRERTAKKYASRQQQQRARFGTDVHERAGRPGK
jgi:hypothetical protein